MPGLYQLSYLALHWRSPYFVNIFVRGVPVRSHETIYCPLACSLNIIYIQALFFLKLILHWKSIHICILLFLFSLYRFHAAIKLKILNIIFWIIHPIPFCWVTKFLSHRCDTQNGLTLPFEKFCQTVVSDFACIVWERTCQVHNVSAITTILHVYYIQVL